MRMVADDRPLRDEQARPSVREAVGVIRSVEEALPSPSELSNASDGELLELARVASWLVKRLQAVGVGCVGVLGRRQNDGTGQASESVGFAGTAQLVQNLTGSSISQARAQARLASATAPDSDGNSAFPLVAEALHSGRLTDQSATQIVDTIAAHDKAGGESGQEMESHLVGVALGLEARDYESVEQALASDGTDDSAVHFDEVRRACQHAASAWSPKAAADVDRQVSRRRNLTIGMGRDGLMSIRGSLLPEVGATLEAMLNAITSPRVKEKVPEAQTGHKGSEPGDFRTPAHKRHDAFASVLNAAAASSSLPLMGGSPITVLVQTSEENLRSHRAGVIHTNGGPAPISPLAVEHAACGGAVQFFAADPKGRLVSLGNQQRAFTAHQRRAILARDGGCVIPGCDIPAAWCEAHHVVPHANGGQTHTDNGVLLCYYHHRHIETSGWNVRMEAGVPWVRAPKWIDPTRQWKATRRSQGQPATEHMLVSMPRAS